MPQPKSSSTSSRTARTPAAAKAKPAAKPKAAAKPAVAKKPAAAKTRAAAKPKPVAAKAAPKAKPAARSTPAAAAAKPKTAAKSRAAAAKAAPKSAPKPKAATTIPSLPGADQLPDSLAAVLDTLHRGVVLQRERLQEVVDDAVSRGRLTRGDAEDLVQSLMVSGRRQAEDILTEVEKAFDRGLREVGTATRQARRRTAASPVTREVDRARRRIGVGGFPILGYDDLTAAQIAQRLPDLTPAQLRKVRDYERRNADRKGVLNGIEKHLR